MPTIRHIDKTVDVKLRYLTASNQKAENVFQFEYSVQPSVPNLTTFASNLAANLGLTLRGPYNSAVRFTEILVKDIGPTDGSGAQVLYTFPDNTTGLAVGDALPASAACSVELRTARGGKSGSGSKSLSGFCENDQSADTWSNAILALITNLALKWLVSYIVGGVNYIPSVGSEKLHTSYNLTGFSILDPYVDSQKTRLPTHGD